MALTIEAALCLALEAIVDSRLGALFGVAYPV